MINAHRYSAVPPIELPDRRWPTRRITAPPRWLSTDLRDGNQALINPMDPARKLMLFELLVRMGYKEIEVGFPVSGQDDHAFVRMLIEQERIPDDVRISVLVQARDELIERTVRSLEGVPRATLHLYNATSPLFRRVVFGIGREECRDMAVQGTRLFMKYADKYLSGTDLGFQYSPELFSQTEPEFALEVCEAVMDEWSPGPGREIIINLPATVESCPPNEFADRVEWMDRHLSRREHVCLSIHPHNDRGTGVAATELAQLAGAQRVEGCLFGNGERAGNVCLVTLAMNLYTQGVDPGVDLSDITEVRRVVEHCTELPVHPRHPYGGDLVYTSFAGSHQDAIKKGFDDLAARAAAARRLRADLPWEMPYLPLDPQDVGRMFEAVVRVNSQSGKGGTAYLMSTCHGVNLPRGLRKALAAEVQRHADATGGEVTAEDIWRIFADGFLARDDEPVPRAERLPVALHVDGEPMGYAGDARDDAIRTIGTALASYGIDVQVVHRSGTAGGPLGVYAQCWADGREVWGAGLGEDVTEAALSAVRAAQQRHARS